MPNPLSLYLFSADYSYESNGDPVVRLFCKDRSSRSCTVFVRGFKPYFYLNPELESEDALGALREELLQRFNQIRDIQIVDRFTPFGYQDEKKKMLLIVAQDPKNVRELRESAKNYGTIYEADILFKNRFLVDTGLRSNSWIKARSYRPTRTNTVSTKRKLETIPSNLELDDFDEHPELRYLCVDIECLAESGDGMPQPEVDPIIMISLSFSQPFEGRDNMVLVSRPVSIEDTQGMESEEEMLRAFLDILKRFDPDVLLGYNSNQFDFPYIIDRMRGLGIKPKMGRAEKNSYYRTFGNSTRVNITGRVVVDVLPLVKKDFALKRYGLGEVSKAILGREKLDVSHTEIPRLWKSQGKGLRKLIDYSRRDAELPLEILLSKRLLDRYIALAQASGTLLQDLVEAGQSIMIDNLLLRELRNYHRVMPCKPDDEETARRKQIRKDLGLKGGHVLEPETGLQENVVVMDYKSLYPTIMIAKNICVSTLKGKGFVSQDEYRGIVPRILEELLSRRLEIKEKLKQVEKEEEYRILDMTQWAIKILLNSFYGYFGYIRSRMYDLTIANTVTRTGRETITETKRIIEKQIDRVYIADSKVLLKEECDVQDDALEVALRVVYGDTDSVFVKLSPTDGQKVSIGESEASSLGARLGEILTRSLPPPMELQYEAFSQRALFVTKKRYALFCEGKEPAVKVKGLETVRREWCNLATEAMKEVLKLLLRRGDIEAASEYMKSLIEDLREDRIKLDKLIQTRTLSKRPSEYKGRQPHAELCQKMQRRDPASAPDVGTRVPFVITSGSGLLVERAEDPDYVLENGLTLDHEYYIRRQILPPVRRIFEALGFQIDELVADSSQLTLLDAFGETKPKPAAEPKVPKPERYPILGHDLEEFICPGCSASFTIMDLSEFVCPECGEELDDDTSSSVISEIMGLARAAAVKGGTRDFVCGRCGKTYRRIPLSGTCGCSGQVVPRSVEVAVAPLMDLVEAASPSIRNGSINLQMSMIRMDFGSIEAEEAPQMSLGDFL
jgi:DNA polymerase I